MVCKRNGLNVSLAECEESSILIKFKTVSTMKIKTNEYFENVLKLTFFISIWFN